MSEISPSLSGHNGRDVLPDAIIIHAAGIIRFVNPAGLRLFGFSSLDDMVGNDIFRFIRPEDHDIVKERIRQIEAEEIFQSPLREMQLIHGNGSILNVEVTAVCASYKALPAVMCIIVDRSAFKEREEEHLHRKTADLNAACRDAQEQATKVKQASRNLEILTKGMIDGMAVYDDAGRVAWVNPAHIRLIGEDTTDLTWDEWREKYQRMSFSYPDGWTLLQEEYPAIRVLRGETVVDEVLAFNNLQNVHTIVSVSGWPILEEGKISGAAMVMRDITKREEAFQTIRTTCRKINELLESIGDAFLSLDDQWRITYANRRAAKTFGFNEGDMGIQSIWDKIPELKDSTVEQTLRQAMAQRMPCRLKFQTRITKTRYWASVYPGALGLSIYIIDATNLEQTLPD